MSCDLVQGSEIGCRDNVGGVEVVYLANFENVESITATSGVITDITMVGTEKFYTFQVNKEDAQYDSTTTSSIETGTTFYESTLVFTMKKMSASQKNSLSNIAKARLMAIVKDANGTLWVLGETRGVDALEITNGTGKAMGDLNGATVTITGKEPNFDQAFTGTLATIID